MNINIIIPTLNEAKHLPRLLDQLIQGGISKEQIIVSDGGSTDDTKKVAESYEVKFVNAAKKNRAHQMNFGARLTDADWLYFIHADTLPPNNFLNDLKQAMELGYRAGCFRSQFDSNILALKVNAFFTRFKPLWCRGGDQSLYIANSLFKEMNGFSEDHIIMEEYEFIERLQKQGDFYIIPNAILISTRKYENNSYLRVLLANFLAFRMYKNGVAQEKIVHKYRKWLN